MKIGILSDTHNRLNNTRIALETLRDRSITRLIHCGDVTTAITVALFAGWDVTFVYGNADLDWDELAESARVIGVPRPQLSHEIEVDGKWIGVAHGHDYNTLHRLTICGKYAYVCHGHTHERRNEYLSPYGVRLINPGALGGSRSQTRSVCILDTDVDQVQFIEFPDMI